MVWLDGGFPKVESIKNHQLNKQQIQDSRGSHFGKDFVTNSQKERKKMNKQNP